MGSLVGLCVSLVFIFHILQRFFILFFTCGSGKKEGKCYHFKLTAAEQLNKHLEINISMQYTLTLPLHTASSRVKHSHGNEALESPAPHTTAARPSERVRTNKPALTPDTPQVSSAAEQGLHSPGRNHSNSCGSTALDLEIPSTNPHLFFCRAHSSLYSKALQGFIHLH